MMHAGQDGRKALRRNVGRELTLEKRDLVFEVEFAFLEALELELILNCTLSQAADDVV
jgi:hypothetical protein